MKGKQTSFQELSGEESTSLFELTGTAITSISTVPWIETHDHRGTTRFDVGDVTYIEKDDRYVQVEQLTEITGKFVAKVKYFAAYQCDEETGIDSSAKDDFDGFRYVFCYTLQEPLIFSVTGNTINFIGSIRFDLDFNWMTAHINSL